MEPKLQRWIQRRGWDRASTSYERYWQTQLQPALDLVLTTADLQPGENVIDVACGTGLVTLPAAVCVAPGGRVLATDLSPKMIADLERNATAAGLTNVAVACCDAEHLDVPGAFDVDDVHGIDEMFDVALCSLGLMYVPAPDTAARRAPSGTATRRPHGRVGVGSPSQLRLGRALPDRRRPCQLGRVPDVLRVGRSRIAHHDPRRGRLRRHRGDAAPGRAGLRRRCRGAGRGLSRRPGRSRSLEVRRGNPPIGVRGVPGVARRLRRGRRLPRAGRVRRRLGATRRYGR